MIGNQSAQNTKFILTPNKLNCPPKKLETALCTSAFKGCNFRGIESGGQFLTLSVVCT